MDTTEIEELTTRNAIDQVYRHPHQHISPFSFDKTVAQVFPDMIQRSVPGYQALLELIGSLGKKVIRPNTRVYDLGCSHGAVTYQLSHTIQQDPRLTNVKFIAIDNAPAMIEQAKAKLGTLNNFANIQLQQDDIRHIRYENASLAILNYCLQFLPIEDRTECLERIYQGLLPGGLLLLSEKTRQLDENEHRWFTETHEQYKSHQGYSALEISQKRQALESVLKIETLAQHTERLKAVGFRSVHVFFQCLQFVGIAAEK